MFFSGNIQQRYILTLFGFVLTIITAISKYSMSITITEMVKQKYDFNETIRSINVCPVTETKENETIQNKSGEFEWSSESQGLIISAVFWVYPFIQTPCGVLTEKYGAKIVLVSGQLLSGVSMIALPFVSRSFGVIGVIILRVIIGCGQAAVYPCLGFLLANWVPPQETASLGGIILVGENVGIIIAMAVSGLILGFIQNSWPLTFYLYGAITIIWAILWILFGYNDPTSNPFISEKEKEYLRINIQKGIQKKSGLLSALPYVIICFTATGGGWLSDLLHRKEVSTSISRKLLATVSSVGPALGLVGVMYAGCNKTISVLMFTLGMSLMGFFYSSLGVNPVDLSPNYAGTVMGIIGYGTISGIISPYLTSVTVKHNTLEEWYTIFGISIGMLIISDLIFIIFGSGKVQHWDSPS